MIGNDTVEGRFELEEQIIEEAIAKRDDIPEEVRKYLGHFIRNELVRLQNLVGKIEKGYMVNLQTSEIKKLIWRVANIMDQVKT